MDTGLVFVIIISVIIVLLRNNNSKEINYLRNHVNFHKYVAYHEAGHTVFALYNGYRCLDLLLNIDANNKIIHKDLMYYGCTLLDTSKFTREFNIIKKSTIINFNIDLLPKDADTISFAKRQLQIMYAGDIVLYVFFNKKIEKLFINLNTKLIYGEDKHIIQNIHDYLEKMGQSISKEEIINDIIKTIENNKEMKAAIHFLADTMLKNPGVQIAEEQILSDLKMCNFFNLYK